MQKDGRILVIGAGPVGLCLSLALAQAGIRSTLVEQLGEHNFLEQNPLITVRLLTEFTAFRQTGDKVVATVSAEDGSEERIEGDYIVSCEGARSLVRKELDIEFEGFTYSDRTLNIEVGCDFRSLG